MGKVLTPKEIDVLPTIMEVVEQISAMENHTMLQMASTIPTMQFYDEGRYSFVSDSKNHNIVRLMPVSPTPFLYFRGQSRYHDPCVPTLYRGKKKGELPPEEDVAGNRIKICEFAMLLNTHPVFCEVLRNTQVDAVALAQHYGLPTEYLDLTNSKWVAAFFASTRYDSATDTYYPVGRDYKEGYGVMYVTNTAGHKFPEEFFEKNQVIGYQYFERPSKQSSFGFKMDKGEDFNNNPFFDKVFFKHDIEASTIVYNMAYRQNRFVPKDELSKLARKIAESKEVTRMALFHCWQVYYQDKDPAYLDEVCAKKGWKVREDAQQIVKFDDAVLAADWKKWNEFGREDLKSRILPLIAVTSVPYNN